MIYFTSDLHFCHANILLPTYCDRPYAGVEAMNEGLVRNWNSRIRDEDSVYVLGDITIIRKANDKRVPELRRLLGLLKGKKFLVPGNHDSPQLYELFRSCGFVFLENDTLIPLPDGKEAYLSHYPLKSLDRISRIQLEQNQVLLHGHSHSKPIPVSTKDTFQLDIGVDGYQYRPWSIHEVMEYFAPRWAGT